MFITELFTHWTYQVFAPGTLLRRKYNAFKELLEYDDRCLERIADIEEMAYGNELADWARAARLSRELLRDAGELVQRLQVMNPTRYMTLPDYFNKVRFYVAMDMDDPDPAFGPPHVISLAEAADRPDLAGGKAHKVALVAEETYLDVPDGFVITSNAFNYILESDGLRPELNRLLSEVAFSRPDELERLCAEMRELVLNAEVPESLARDILDRARALAGESGSLAVRSSAMAEDSELSFAGQYDSVLCVAPEKVLEAYKQVLAGKYAPRAVTYRIMGGLADTEAPMGCLVMPLVEAKSAGVIYTRDMDRSQTMGGVLSVYAVPGLGENLVSGRAEPEIWCFSRDAEPEIFQEPPEEGRVLSEAKALELARQAMELEEMFGEPQDVEWAMDAKGKLFVLQSRPLREEAAVEVPAERPGPDVEPLLSGAMRASRGVGAGVVVRQGQGPVSARDLPEGAVLCVRDLDPGLAECVGKLAAVVAQGGSRASHFASIAREFGLPVLVGVQNVFEVLAEGKMVTVDADSGTVFRGRLEALLVASGETGKRPNPAMDRLKEVLPRISKLTLTDPESEGFKPERVQSVHDVVRFSHEKAVAEMFTLVGKGGRGLGQARKLSTPLPIVLYVLDVGGGLFSRALEKKEVTADDIQSPPMWSLWWGLSSDDIAWSEGLVHMDWEEFDRVSGGIFGLESKLLASYAVVSEDYAHLMIRFGYHFSQVDALCGPDPQKNYVNFRFKGGGGSLEQRELRLVFLSRVLGEYGFTITTRGDLLDARVSREDEGLLQRKLYVLGRVLGKTRMMDMGLVDQSQAEEMADAFLAATHEREGRI